VGPRFPAAGSGMTWCGIKGTVRFECNTCRAVLDTKTGDWYDACTALALAGWSARQHVEWMHTCDQCRNKEREKRKGMETRR
jgi:hypothetical protein